MGRFSRTPLSSLGGGLAQALAGLLQVLQLGEERLELLAADAISRSAMLTLA